MRSLRISAYIVAAAAMAACSSTGGDNPDPVVNTPVGNVNQLNTTLGPLSYGNPNRGEAVNESFSAAATGITLQQSTSGTGLEFVSLTQGDFSNIAPNDDPSISSVTFNAADSTLTFDISNGDLSLQDTIGPIFLADPGDFANLLNDDLSILIAAFPGRFFAGQGFNPADFEDDPSGVDQEIERIRALGTEESAEYLTRLNEIVREVFLDQDFYGYGRGEIDINNDSVITSEERLRYSQLKITGTNSGTTTNYVALGIWNNPPAEGVAGDISYGVTIYGAPTPPGELPDTGTATYDTTIAGWLLRQNKVEELRGSVILDADFATRNISAQVNTLIAATGPSGETIFTEFTRLSGNGDIREQNSFSGNLRGLDDPSLTGGYEGAFFGPGAAEAGGTFTFSNDDIAASAGFVGPRDGATTSTGGN